MRVTNGIESQRDIHVEDGSPKSHYITEAIEDTVPAKSGAAY